MTMNEYFGALEPKVKSRVHINTPAQLELCESPIQAEIEASSLPR